MPVDCLNPYSLSKHVGEELMTLYERLYSLSTVSLRFFNVYGPRHKDDGAYATVIAIFLRQLVEGRPFTIVGDGEQRRDFTHVADVRDAVLLALFNREVTGVVNIGTGQNFSINEIAAMIDPTHPVEHIAKRLGEARTTLALNARALVDLGWQPSVSIEDGLKELKERRS